MPKVKHSKAGKSGKPGKKGGKASGNIAMPRAPPPGPARPAVWRPGQDGVEEGEALEYDPSAYDCLHAFTLEWPCLRYVLRCRGKVRVVTVGNTARKCMGRMLLRELLILAECS
jgi:hypothetical protein